MGYSRAGFEVVGVDVKPQPRYPFEFYQADALEFVREHGKEFEIIHASPPCQAHSAASKCWSGGEVALRHKNYVGITRSTLQGVGVAYVIENVVGAPLIDYITLCGVMFGLKVYRHRLFESNLFLLSLSHQGHPERVPLAGRGASHGGYISVAGNFADVEAARVAMEIPWMVRDELSQAIPPAYTEYVGEQLMWHLEAAA